MTDAEIDAVKSALRPLVNEDCWAVEDWLDDLARAAILAMEAARTPPGDGEVDRMIAELRAASKENTGWEPSASRLERIAAQAADLLSRMRGR